MDSQKSNLVACLSQEMLLPTRSCLCNPIRTLLRCSLHNTMLCLHPPLHQHLLRQYLIFNKRKVKSSTNWAVQQHAACSMQHAARSIEMAAQSKQCAEKCRACCGVGMHTHVPKPTQPEFKSGSSNATCMRPLSIRHRNSRLLSSTV